jgi:hypothetical protein
MASISSYTFNNMARLGADSTDQTQRNVSNTRFTNYTLSNYFSQNMSNEHVNFALPQQTMNFSGMVNGSGLNGSVVDVDSMLNLKKEDERPLEKLQLFERPFLTVPYLGRGSCDPSLESQLQQGELVSDKKSVSTIMEKSFANYALYPTDDKMNERVKNPAYNVEESALNGWTRGGAATREMLGDAALKQNNRPSGSY